MKKHLKIIEDNKASKGIRFANLLLTELLFMSYFLFSEHFHY
ncbi:hypothetical protein [Chryseobacterium formosus]|nr:hypothetical protein [Chryseobacterium formosus]